MSYEQDFDGLVDLEWFIFNGKLMQWFSEMVNEWMLKRIEMYTGFTGLEC